MATENHKILANTIKNCHIKLRELYKEYGETEAWEKHKADKSLLETYSIAMYELAKIWEKNSEDPASPAFSRIKWATDFCLTYYYQGVYLTKREREIRLLRFWYPFIDLTDFKLLKEIPKTGINILDVGSCYNAFAVIPNFNVTALDLCPSNKTVLSADFLTVNIVNIEQTVQLVEGKVYNLKAEHFHCVIFSLLLEYLPSSSQRLICVKKAYEALCTEGILIIITPDSAHLGKNVKLWKQWRQTLASIGFIRICFEKLPCITCMVYRKPIHNAVSQKWLEGQQETFSKELHIPQDDEI